MDGNVFRARRTNKITGMVIAVQLALLVCIGVLLIQVLANNTLPWPTLFSSVFLILVCLPLSVFLYTWAQDRTVKKVFQSYAAAFGMMIVSGILWYIVPLAVPGLDTVPAAKVVMVLSYLPFIVALFSIDRSVRPDVSKPAKALILFLSTALAAIIVMFVALRLVWDGGSVFDAGVYTFETIVDVIILSICPVLALHFMQNRLRDVFLFMLAFFTLSLAGDALNLLGALGVTDLAGYAAIVYSLMFTTAGLGMLAYALSTDVVVTTVEEITRKLHDTRSLMTDLIMQSPDAIGVFDVRGDEVMANGPFAQLAGPGRGAAAGPINLFRDLDRLFTAPADLARVRDGGMVAFEGQKATRNGNGRASCYLVKAFPARGSGGQIIGYFAFVTDITDRKRYEADLVRAKKDAELYLDLMSHDIRNMNQIGIGFLELALERLYLDSEGSMLIRKPLEAMLNSSHLIDNVKKIRRADTGQALLERIDLGEALDDVVRDYAGIADRDARIEYTPVYGCYVMANPLLKDVFANLISNAFKHSTGPLTVCVKVSPVDRNGARYYRVVVEDNGPGIPDELKRVIMDSAYRVRTKTGGRGLGLYLVKTLVEGFNGTIAVEDRVPGDRSQGTRATVLLPAADGPARDARDAGVACD